MNQRILTVRVAAHHLALVRDRTRQVGELAGLDKLDCTRFITAVSEIARNAVEYAGEASLTFTVAAERDPEALQYVCAELTDKGPGIDDLDGYLAGKPNAKQRIPMGLAGCRRLADRFDVVTSRKGGTLVTVGMALPRSAPRLRGSELANLAEQLARRKPRTPVEELEQQNREMLLALQSLNDRQAELERADVRKNEFVATLAHELRNPLATMHMTLALLERMRSPSGEQLEARHAVLGRQVKQMSQLVDDLMDASRVSQGKIALDRKPTELNEIVSQSLEMTGAAIKARAHEVHLQLHGEPLWVVGDSARLKQVLSNLMHNAARYSADKGRIAIRVRREQASAVVEVADQGIGIDAGLLPHIFGLFVQGQAPTDGMPSGLGVGLTLAQKLVEEHGGTIAAASLGSGHGSQFTVTLPLAGVAD